MKKVHDHRSFSASNDMRLLGEILWRITYVSSITTLLMYRVENHEPYFVQRRNAAKMFGLSSLQKVTAALRILAYGVGADLIDEYIRIGETTAIKGMKLFVKAVILIFRDVYLRSPNSNGIARLLAIGVKQGFPYMLRSIDYMHWK
ncbi:uncharacterized protein LOC122022790 [Zingiber officinale]|uniref:uncharacterized protein LOC122022790 n=1 Tax=Zingiber officinale TaxID=94328 RepID=UPI001C4B6F17|nr:uncharacterized protein LOC122022790 [Zingiber officinale]